MYHPSRGGVRGGRDQFKWDDVKVDKHRENYLGHSVKAPVGRWQKGKDLFWYSKDKHAQGLEQAALKDEIQRVKEEEEQLMREALGLAPKRSNRPQGNRLDKHEFSELVKRGSTAEDLGGGHADAAKVDGLGFARAPRVSDMSTSVLPGVNDVAAETVKVSPEHMDQQEEPDKEIKQKKRKRDEKRHDKHEERKHKKHEKHEKRHSRDSKDKSSSRDSKGKSSCRDTKDKSKHRKDKEKRRHDSDSE